MYDITSRYTHTHTQTLTWLCAVGSLASKPTSRVGSPDSSSHCLHRCAQNSCSCNDNDNINDSNDNDNINDSSWSREVDTCRQPLCSHCLCIGV